MELNLYLDKTGLVKLLSFIHSSKNIGEDKYEKKSKKSEFYPIYFIKSLKSIIRDNKSEIKYEVFIEQNKNQEEERGKKFLEFVKEIL